MRCLALFVFVSLLDAPISLPAQSITSSPVGFTTASCLGNSDTLISVPFTRPPAFAGIIQSVSGSTINVANASGWSTNQFVYAAGTQPNHYYALIAAGGASNPKEGHFYSVTANNANTLTVDTTTDSLSGIVVNTQILLIPFWTPATLFPATDANVSFTPTTSSASYQTEILIPDRNAAGINLPYAVTYFFSNNVDGTSSNVGWRAVGNNTANRGDDPLLPNSYFVVRNGNGAPTLPFVAAGSVLTHKLATVLLTATQAQDNPVAMVRPIGVALTDTGLSPADGSFQATPLMRSIKNQFFRPTDELLLFDNSQVGFNKSPSAIYCYADGANKSGGWKLVGDGLADHSADVIPAGSAIVIRKARTATPQSVYWTNAPTY